MAIDNALSYERIKLARETLTKAAFVDGFPGAVESTDHAGCLIEAKRNLTSLVQYLHGDEEFERMLDSD